MSARKMCQFALYRDGRLSVRLLYYTLFAVGLSLFVCNTATASAASGLVSDSFNGVLDTDTWNFVDPLNDSDFDVTGSHLALNLAAGTSHNLWVGALNAPRLMQAAKNTDFTVETKIDSPMSLLYQVAGVIVANDADDLMRFDVYHDGSQLTLFSGVFFNGKSLKSSPLVIEDRFPVYLRVKRLGNEWTHSYSYDGIDWVDARVFLHGIRVNSVGLFAANPGPYAPAYQGLFDYFLVDGTPPAEGSGNSDTTAPSLSDIQLAVDGAAAVISWQTDEPATTRVEYGLTDAYGSAVDDFALATTHRIGLSGLTVGQSYHVRLTSIDGAGNRADSADLTLFTDDRMSVHVTAVNGQSGNPLANRRIRAFRRFSDQSEQLVSTLVTNADGVADFQLPPLETDQYYLFKMTSPFDNRTWQSEEVSQTGAIRFVVGNSLLDVRILNALTEEPLSDQKIGAFLRLTDGSLEWTLTKTSDAQGWAGFELPGLGEGSRYVLVSKPYGLNITSADIVAPGEHQILAGALVINLVQKSDGASLSGKSLTLYEEVPDSGQLKWMASAKTNTLGQVYFDPPGLNGETRFVVKATGLFGNQHAYFSSWIHQPGTYDFAVAPGIPPPLDQQSPVFQSIHPQNYASMADSGFALSLKVTDDNAVDTVDVRVTDPIKGIAGGSAVLDAGVWKFSVTPAMISSGQLIDVEAEATDQFGNVSVARAQYYVVHDTEAPVINVGSHGDGDVIDANGLFMTGTVVDNTHFLHLYVALTEAESNRLLLAKEVEVGPTNHWGFVARDLPSKGTIVVTLSAVDSSGNSVQRQLSLPVADSARERQLLNRLTFGATPELIREIRQGGADAFIDRQLNPESIDDTDLENRLQALYQEHDRLVQRLQEEQFIRAIYSRRQLLELMTHFWESHFNTDIDKVGVTVDYETRENQLFRANALGNFRDLLQISATSPAMLYFLDNKFSHKKEPNENYARELLELHTLGVDNGYTSTDIAELARVFTGWSVVSKEFRFVANAHDDGEKTVLGQVIPAGSGQQGGETVLDFLAAHSGTAKFVCTKLLKVFVSDTPTDAAISDCSQDFLTYRTDHRQIAKVLEGIFKSEAFYASELFHSKVKTPLIFVAGFGRQFPMTIYKSQMREWLDDMGMRLFYYPLPTGWPIGADFWVDSNQLIQRWKIVRNTVFNSPSQWRTFIEDPKQLFIDNGMETTESILGFLFETALAMDFNDAEWQEAEAVLASGGSTETFDIYGEQADASIRALLALVLQFPAYQLQ